MGSMGWVLGLGALAIGGWCFIWGPCKGWVDGLINKTDGSTGIIGESPQTNSDLRSKFQRLVDETDFDKEIRAAANSKTVQNMTPAQQAQVGRNIGLKYKPIFDSYYAIANMRG